MPLNRARRTVFVITIICALALSAPSASLGDVFKEHLKAALEFHAHCKAQKALLSEAIIEAAWGDPRFDMDDEDLCQARALLEVQEKRQREEHSRGRHGRP